MSCCCGGSAKRKAELLEASSLRTKACAIIEPTVKLLEFQKSGLVDLENRTEFLKEQPPCFISQTMQKDEQKTEANESWL